MQYYRRLNHLNNDHDGDIEEERFQVNSQRITGKVVLAHAMVALSYCVAISILFLLMARSEKSSCEHQEFYSPAKTAISIELQSMNVEAGHFAGHNPFVGEPRPALDEAWDNSLQNVHVRVTAEEFRRLQPQVRRKTLRLPDDSYIIRLGVYHELHCLKWIRKWMHRNHYWPELKGDALRERRWHIEHCLEHFRLSSMHTASLAPATFYLEESAGVTELRVNGSYLTYGANWHKLDAWAAERRVDVTELNVSALVD